MNIFNMGFEFLAKLMTNSTGTKDDSDVEPAKDSGLWLQKLSICDNVFSPAGTDCGLLGKFCCGVKNLTMDSFDVTAVQQVFHQLAKVENLELGFYQPESRMVDAVFCGVYPEEVAELERKDAEYLKAVHIVPVRPSILHVEGLKKLLIRQRSSADQCGFTIVSAGICFSRIPKLTVQLAVVKLFLELEASSIEHFLAVMSNFPEVEIEQEVIKEF